MLISAAAIIYPLPPTSDPSLPSSLQRTGHAKVLLQDLQPVVDVSSAFLLWNDASVIDRAHQTERLAHAAVLVVITEGHNRRARHCTA